jgi:hypothetical protein
MSVRLRGAIALVLSTACALGPAARTARADTPPPVPAAPDAAKTEARDRFDRGLRLFNDGDNAGALAEFKRAYELIPNTLVQYNIGLVYAAMGRPVEAVEALDKVLADPGPVSGDRLTRARTTRDDQAQRIAQLTVTTSVPATIDVDGVGAGQTPLTAPLRISGGVHIVGAVATGYAPVHKEVTIAGGQRADVQLELVQMAGTAAHLTVKTHLPGADLLVDGQAMGKTPLASSLTIAPGAHTVELRRAGYATAQQNLTLGDGADGEVTLEPAEDESAIATGGGRLELTLREAEAVVTIDGKSRGVYVDGYRLAAGPHRLLVQRGGFDPTERDVTVSAGGTTALGIALDPTPETRAAYVSRTTTQRTWGIISVAGGVAIAGGAVALLVWNSGQKSSAQSAYDAAAANLENKVGVCATMSTMGDAAACNQAVSSAQSNYNAATARDPIGYIGIGVGAAATVLGVVLLVTNGSPHRYDAPEASGVAGSLAPAAWWDGHGGGGGLRGSF